MNGSGYLTEDTIAALATAVGGAIAIIRVSGPRAVPVLREIAPAVNSKLQARQIYRVALPDIDDALVVYFSAPNSFTGEDCVEFHIHGSPFVARRLMESLAARGVRQALAGEFSFRAVRNGKMTVNQAQATADLIGASNDQAVMLALEKMSGSQNELIDQIAEGLRQLAALGEVGIDFSDQDIEEVSISALKKRVDPW